MCLWRLNLPDPGAAFVSVTPVTSITALASPPVSSCSLPMLLALIVCHAWILASLAVNYAWMRRAGTVPPMPPSLPSLTVLIPARNEEENLRRLIPSLLEQRYPKVEILVYDDASEDGTAALVGSVRDPRLRLVRGEGPPPGWMGKVYALAEASREATGEVLLFLDADAELRRPDALARLVARWSALPAPAVLTGLPHLVGGGRAIVSAIPYVFLSAAPVPVTEHLGWRAASVLNGQCWMIARETYERWQPHRAHPDAVVEDLAIGRYLGAHGVRVAMRDLQDDVAVWMYRSVRDAWLGLRKNMYPALGGTVRLAVPALALYTAVYLAAPVASPWFLLSLYLMKALSDRAARQPVRVTLLAPLTFAAIPALVVDSAVAHGLGTARWKGRVVARRP